MKNKSFLFLIAALALGLALLGCSSDSDDGGTTTITVNRGYASQIEAINAAFTDGASTVKLVGETSFAATDLDPLVIPAGRTLDLDGYTLTDGTTDAVIIAAGNISGFDKGGKINLTQESYFLAPNQKFIDDNVGIADTSNVQVKLAGSASVAGTATLGPVVAVLNSAGWTAAQQAAVQAGSKGVLLFDLSLSSPLNIGGGHLYVNGDVNLSGIGTVSGVGTLTVSKAVTSGTTADITVVAGELQARSLSSSGGKFAGTVTLTSPSATNADNVLAGSFAKLTGSGAATLKELVQFTLASTILGPVTVNQDTTLYGALTVAGGNVSNGLVIGESGTLTTTGVVNLTTGAIGLREDSRFVLGTDGKLIATNYELATAGSLSTDFEAGAGAAGSYIALTPTSIISGGLTGGTPSLVFGNGQITLNFKADSTIQNLALDVQNTGTISLTPPSGADYLTLTLTNAGSILTGNEAPKIAGTVGEGKLIIAAIPGVGGNAGSLVSGTESSELKALANYGTLANYIIKDIPFVEGVGTGAAEAAASVKTAPNEKASAAETGSIAMFPKP
ncbi:MAG: hypothetical protein LBK66_15265 [Spirochaetaceae bacterium]|jgi:hypothetical protein|nr:hypothetical protein [Spirochaetaceae bacterium]